jgi:nucleoside phosphorylase
MRFLLDTVANTICAAAQFSFDEGNYLCQWGECAFNDEGANIDQHGLHGTTEAVLALDLVCKQSDSRNHYEAKFKAGYATLWCWWKNRKTDADILDDLVRPVKFCPWIRALTTKTLDPSVVCDASDLITGAQGQSGGWPLATTGGNLPAESREGAIWPTLYALEALRSLPNLTSARNASIQFGEAFLLEHLPDPHENLASFANALGIFAYELASGKPFPSITKMRRVLTSALEERPNVIEEKRFEYAYNKHDSHTRMHNHCTVPTGILFLEVALGVFRLMPRACDEGLLRHVKAQVDRLRELSCQPGIEGFRRLGQYKAAVELLCRYSGEISEIVDRPAAAIAVSGGPVQTGRVAIKHVPPVPSAKTKPPLREKQRNKSLAGEEVKTAPDLSVDARNFDVAIFCALYEEARAVKDVFESRGAAWEETDDNKTQLKYFHCTIPNRDNDSLAIYLTWLPEMGPVSMAQYGERILNHHRKFRLLLMTGICAGDKTKVCLGDLVIAKTAYSFDTGKARLVNGIYELDPDPDSRSIHETFQQRLQAFQSWRSLVSGEARPVSKRQQRCELVRQLLEYSKFGEIPTDWLEGHIPAWRQILTELKKGKDPIIDSDGCLVNATSVRERIREDYSFNDPGECTSHICAIASTAAVREDRPFERIHHPVRKTYAIDMEGYSFYKVAVSHETEALLVKGVCDYADPDKDDSYHKYASRVSAHFALSLVREVVTKRSPN